MTKKYIYYYDRHPLPIPTKKILLLTYTLSQVYLWIYLYGQNLISRPNTKYWTRISFWKEKGFCHTLSNVKCGFASFTHYWKRKSWPITLWNNVNQAWLKSIIEKLNRKDRNNASGIRSIFKGYSVVFVAALILNWYSYQYNQSAGIAKHRCWVPLIHSLVSNPVWMLCEFPGFLSI